MSKLPSEARMMQEWAIDNPEDKGAAFVLELIDNYAAMLAERDQYKKLLDRAREIGPDVLQAAVEELLDEAQPE